MVRDEPERAPRADRARDGAGGGGVGEPGRCSPVPDDTPRAPGRRATDRFGADRSRRAPGRRTALAARVQPARVTAFRLAAVSGLQPRPKAATARAYGSGRSRPIRCPAFSIISSLARGILSAKIRA